MEYRCTVEHLRSMTMIRHRKRDRRLPNAKKKYHTVEKSHGLLWFCIVAVTLRVCFAGCRFYSYCRHIFELFMHTFNSMQTSMQSRELSFFFVVDVVVVLVLFFFLSLSRFINVCAYSVLDSNWICTFSHNFLSLASLLDAYDCFKMMMLFLRTVTNQMEFYVHFYHEFKSTCQFMQLFFTVVKIYITSLLVWCVGVGIASPHHIKTFINKNVQITFGLQFCRSALKKCKPS